MRELNWQHSGLKRSIAFVQNHNRLVNVSIFDPPDRNQDGFEQRNFVIGEYDHIVKTLHTTELSRPDLPNLAHFIIRQTA